MTAVTPPAVAGLLALALATPVAAQDHGGMTMPMPGMAMPPPPTGPTSAPPPPAGYYADRFYPAAAMAAARARMMREQGGRVFTQIVFNLAELQARDGEVGYRWDGEAWIGGDVNRLTIKTEGGGASRGGVESAEVQALLSRAIGPYLNLQAGVRHDFQPSPTPTYATFGFEGLAPYMIVATGAAFLSDKGELLGRIEAYYDQRITQRLILQPRVELNFSARDTKARRIGAGLVDAELGLRLRYEIGRRFAPYVGVSHDRRVGRTADYARADGRDVSATGLVSGVRFWF